MKLADYFKEAPTAQRDAKREALAKRCGVTAGYLYLVELGHRKASPALALRIEKATRRKVSRHDSRPDVYPLERRAPSSASQAALAQGSN